MSIPDRLHAGVLLSAYYKTKNLKCILQWFLLLSAYESCKNAILNINLPSIPDNATETERDVHLHSLINFDYHLSLYALGALIKFLGKNWARFATNNEELTFMYINIASM